MNGAMVAIVTMWSSTCILAAAAQAQETIMVDLAGTGEMVTWRASGFLHSITPNEPGDEWLDILRPQLFRSNPDRVFDNYERLNGLGTSFQIVVSDKHGYQKGYWPGDDGDWGRWESLLTDLVGQAREREAVVQWDIWNEPDIDPFWNPVPGDKSANKERYFETWKRGVATIRSMDPKARILGPSNSGFDGNLFSVVEFLEFAIENGCMPDIVSWHDWQPDVIVDHVNIVREFFRKRGIPEPPISINEYVGNEQWTNPGILPWYFAALEKARVESAAHACWPDPEGVSMCFKPVLDGLMTWPGIEPRSVWWVYRAYGELAGRLVPVKGTKEIDGVASLDGGVLRVLLGRWKGEAPVEAELEIRSLLPGNEKMALVQRIPNSGYEALTALPEPDKLTLEAGTDNVRVSLGNLAPGEAVALIIAPK